MVHWWVLVHCGPKPETSDGNIETCAGFLVQVLKMPDCFVYLFRDTRGYTPNTHQVSQDLFFLNHGNFYAL
jgi:hypothetical protein